MKMLCFPHAGGFAFSYYFFKMGKLDKVLPEDVILYEYPHRGARMSEKQYDSFQDCVEEIVKEFEPLVKDNDYVLFGQSLGAYLAYEVGTILQNKYNKKPAIVILSGQMAPCYSKNYIVDYKNPIELNNYLKRMDVSKEFLEKTGNSYIELVCDDLKMFSSYKEYELSENDNLLSKVVVVYGKDDLDIKAELLPEWAKYTQKLVEIKGFEGRHFFFNQCKEEFIDYINSIL